MLLFIHMEIKTIIRLIHVQPRVQHTKFLLARFNTVLLVSILPIIEF